MRRLFWMGVGAAGAVVVARRARRTVERFTPEGVVEQAAEVGRRAEGAVRAAVAQFRSASAERERELVSALLVEPQGGSVAERRAARAAAAPPVVDDDEDDFF